MSVTKRSPAGGTAEPPFGTRTASPPGGPGRFIVSFALFFGLCMCWALAAPMFSSPDEGAHMIRGAGAVRGQLLPGLADNGDQTFDVPSVFDGFAGHPCYAFQPGVSARCMSIPPSGGSVVEPTSAASYLPFYHGLVALPLLVHEGVGALCAIRAVSALIVAALLATALANAIRVRSPAAPVLGLAIAVTPMALFLGGTVNPSGASVAAGAAAWTGGYVLMRQGTVGLTRSVAGFAAPMCVLLLLRRDALAWALIIFAVVVAMGTRARLLDVVRSRQGQLGAVAIASCAVLQLVTSGGQTAGGFLTDDRAEITGSLADSLGAFPSYLWQMIGVQGWLDVYLPAPVYHGWLMLLGLIVLMALGWASRRMLLVVAGLLITVVAAPTVIGMVRYPYLQGRYLLPVAVGLPLIAGCALAEKGRLQLVSGRLLATGLGVAATLHLLAFHQHLRRYAVGTGGDWWYFPDAIWDPPVGSAAVLTILYGLVLAGTSTWLFAIGRPSVPSERDTTKRTARSGEAVCSPDGGDREFVDPRPVLAEPAELRQAGRTP